MLTKDISHDVTLAVRAYAERIGGKANTGSFDQDRSWPRDVLVFDTETTIDELQHLTFGSWRQCEWTKSGDLVCITEGILYADDLPVRDASGFAVLKKYVAQRGADVAPNREPTLQFMNRTESLRRVFWDLAFKARALVVGFNLPFDLSRLISQWGEARGKYYGGFSCVLWQYVDSMSQHPREKSWAPRLRLEPINSKSAFMQFLNPIALDPLDVDIREEGRKHVFGGYLLDLRTAAYALTSDSHSLRSACEVYGVEHAKQIAPEHGRITEQYVDYNRRDVLATAELLAAVRRDFDGHPLPKTNAWKLFSPASMAKAYMKQLGVTPPRQKFVDLPVDVYGIAMNAFYGGRAECRIRNTAVPVVHTDFVSMYPTVIALQGLWQLMTAERMVVEDYTAEAARLVRAATLDSYLEQPAWRHLTWFGEIVPDDDILPARANYDASSTATNIGVNHVSGTQPLWYAGPDLIASALLRGKPPTIRRAIRLVPQGEQSGMQPVDFAGGTRIDPASGDFFVSVIESRKRTEKDASLPESKRKATAQAFKILANATYGILVELNMKQLPQDESAPVRVHSMGRSFDTSIRRPEDPGPYFFPPVGVLITAGARLMLALVERLVTDAGGTYAFCDTDSMAIVATERGGLVACEGGPLKTRGGKSAVRALAWRDVHAIRQRFVALNPYAKDAVRGSILQAEKVNFDEGTPRQLFAMVISAKRYALFALDKKEPRIVKASEHGLGHLLNPLPGQPATVWVNQTWSYILAAVLGRPLPVLSFWGQAALSQITISSPHVLRPFTEAQSDCDFSERIRPLNFLLSGMVKRFGHPADADKTRFHLLRPFSTDREAALRLPWTDLYTGHEYDVTTASPAPPHVAQLKSYGDVVAEYMTHPESKSADAHGRACGRVTRGLLHRRRIRVARIVLIGKETNRLEEVQQGLVHDRTDVQTVYEDPQLDPWLEVLPKLRAYSATDLAKAAGISTRAVRAIRNGHSRPNPDTQSRLIRFLEKPQRRKRRKVNG